MPIIMKSLFSPLIAIQHTNCEWPGMWLYARHSVCISRYQNSPYYPGR